MRSTASMPSICGMVMSMSTMSGEVRLNSAMAVETVAGLTGYFPAEELDHLDDVFAPRRRNRPQRDSGRVCRPCE